MRTLMFVGAIAAAAAGCTLEDPNTGDTTQQAKIQNRLASNRLASNRLASNRLASNRLASNSISSTRLVALAETADILSTAEGRDVYSYIISCALPAPTEISFEVPGPAFPDVTCTATECPNYTCVSNRCTFYGNLGLAPRWAEHRLGHADRGWVSACMFARVNATETAEAISLRGRNDGLVVTPEESGEFGLEEGAFYGNLFTDAPEGTPPDWNACRGADKAASPTLGGLGNRRCAEENLDGNAEYPAGNPGFTYCGFKYAGDCRDFEAPVNAYACDGFDEASTSYSNCRNTPAENGKWKRSTNYRQVITSYVSNL